MKEIVLEVLPREKTGKEHSRRLRRAGMVPGVLYGARINPRPIELNGKELVKALTSKGAENALIDLRIGEDAKRGKKAVVREVQYDPVTGEILHIDFQHVSMKEKINVKVPVHLVGTSVGVKNAGGVMQHIIREVEISCLPSDIPEAVELDVTNLNVGDSIHVSDIKFEKAEVVTDPNRTVVTINPPTVVKVAEPVAEEVEEAEAEAEAEAEEKAKEEAAEESESEKE